VHTLTNELGQRNKSGGVNEALGGEARLWSLGCE
jgi:hypothetical protein